MRNGNGNGGDKLARAADVAHMTGTSYDPAEADDKLRKAQSSNVHLIAPATRCDVLPPGCAVTMSALSINHFTETYPVQGGLGLSKVALNKLGMLLGVSWDPKRSRRLDDGRHPYRCHYVAVGYYKSFDGQLQVITGEKDLDLRDGSPTVQMMQARAAKKDKTADDQIREIRGFILEHAETKAKNRAIRSMGIKTSYTREELERPFVAARLIFTGQTDDPQLRQAFAMATAHAMLSGQNALYGVPQQPVSMPMPALANTAPTAPATAHDPETGEVIEARQPAEPDPCEVEPLQLPDDARTPVPDADTSVLVDWERRIAGDLADGIYPPEEVEEWRELRAEIKSELVRRDEGPRDAPSQQGMRY